MYRQRAVLRRISRSTSVLVATGLFSSAVVNANNQNDDVFEEVVVTGQKTERSLQETTTSVDVTTSEDIEKYNISDLQDIYSVTANVVSTFGGSSFTIRGISNDNTTGVGLGDLATIYIDGAPMPREFVQGGATDLWDVEQVEIMRGPQSTLQGRNSLAGAVIINTVNPSFEWNGRMRVQAFDQGGEKRVGLAVGGPIIEDQVAFRLAGEWREGDGFVYNPTRKEYASESGATMFRAKVLIEPSALPDLSVLLTHTVDDREGPQSLSHYNTAESNWDNRTISSDLEHKNDTKLTLTSLNIGYDLSDELSFTSLSTLNKLSRIRQRDNDFTEVVSQTTLQRMNPKTFTQEFRFNFDNDHISAVFGAYYSKLDDSENDGFSRRVLFPESVGLADLLAKNPRVPSAVIPLVVDLYSSGVSFDASLGKPVEIETKALFADLTWFMTERFKLFAGLRYDKETQKVSSIQTVTLGELPAANSLGASLAPVIQGVNGFLQSEADKATKPDEVNDSSFNELLPKLGIGYDFTDDMNMAFVVQRGYRSGGVAVNSARASVHKFEPEFTWNYELSFRSQWLDNRLTANANVFYVDWTDQQVQVSLSDNGFDFETRNAGSSRLYGFELETQYEVQSGFNLFASLGRVDSKFLDFTTSIDDKEEDFSGNEFANSPRYSFALGGSLHVNNYFFSTSFSQIGGRFTRPDEDQSGGHDLKWRALLNAKVGYKTDSYGIYLVGSNLLNHEYIDSNFEVGNKGLNIARYGKPRVIGLSFEAGF